MLSTVNAIADEKISDNDRIDVSVFNTISEGKEYIDYSELTIANIPNKLIESTGIDISQINSLDTVDAQNLNSFTTVNNDGMKTLYVFMEPIKYVEQSTNKVCFIKNQCNG